VAIRMIEEAPAHLVPGGELWMVANRFLDYRTPLGQAFAHSETAYEDNNLPVYKSRRS